MRQSRFTILVKFNGKDANRVISAIIEQVKNLPAGLRQSLTWCRGLELAQHNKFTVATDIQVYFCDPRSIWQGEINKNINRLLRK